MTRQHLILYLAFSISAFFPIQPVTGQDQALTKLPLAVSLIASEDTTKEADVLAAALSNGPNLVSVLERGQLVEIIQEGVITSSTFARLESAPLILILESFEFESRRILATRAVNRDTSRIIWSDFFPDSTDLDDWSSQIKDKLAQSRNAPRNLGTIRVSIKSLHLESEPDSPRSRFESSLLSSLVIKALGNWPELEVVERLDLGQVEFERFLTRFDHSGEQEADISVSGAFQITGESGAIRLNILNNRKAHSLTTNFSTDHGGVVELARRIAESIAETAEAREAAAPGEARYTEILGPSEARYFFDEAKRNFRLGLYSLATRHAESAQLIDHTGNPGFEGLRIQANFLRLFPGLPGIPEQTYLPQIKSPDGRIHALDLWEFHQSEHGSIFDPTREDWEVINLTILDLADFIERHDNRENTHHRTLLKQELRRIRYLLDPFLENMIWSSYGRAKQSNFAEGSTELLEMGRNLTKLNALQQKAHPDLNIGMGNPFSSAAVMPASSEAVTSLNNELYPDQLSELRSLPVSKAVLQIHHFSLLRNKILKFLGLTRSDNSSRMAGQEFAEDAFVGFAGGAPITPRTLFLEATAPHDDAFECLRIVDRAFMEIQLEEPGEARRKAFARARTTLNDQAAHLDELGLLGTYATFLLQIDMNRHLEGGFFDPDNSTLDYWRGLHQAAYRRPISGEWSFTTMLRYLVENGKITIDQPDQARKILAFLFEDAKSYNQRVAEDRRINESYLESFQQGLREPVKKIEGLDDIGTEEHLRIPFTTYSYWGAPTLASHIAAPEAFLLKHDIRDQNRDADSGVAIFKYGQHFSSDFIDMPRSVSDLFFEYGEHGALDVREDKILIGAPGAVAIYDRKSKEWGVTQHTFLRDKKGFTFVGNHLVSYLGSEFDGSYGESTVHGLYGLQLDSGEVTALIDTSRRPPIHAGDWASNLRFVPPIVAGKNSAFVLRIHGFPTKQELPLKLCRFMTADPTIPPMPLDMQIPMKSHHYSTGVTTNDTTTILLQNRLKRNMQKDDPEDRFQVAAISRRPGQQGIQWVLDSDYDRTYDLEAYPSFANFNEGKTQPLYSFPSDHTLMGTSSKLNPSIWYDGQQLLFLSGQLTQDGRRLLYVWRSPSQRYPIRIAVAFDSFSPGEGKNYTQEDADRYNKLARDTIRNISIHKNLMFFEFAYGFFVFDMQKLQDHLESRTPLQGRSKESPQNPER